MRKSGLALASVAALALAACGSETSGEFTTEDGKNAEYTIDKDTGETSMTIKSEDGTATLRSGSDVPVNLPSGFSLLSGSKVINSTVVNQPDGQGTMVMFETDAKSDAVIAHYREQAKSAGFDIELEMNTNETAMIAGKRESDGSSLSVTITSGEPSTGQIIIGSQKKR
ncbi:MAG TPA: hypothetical protein VK913_11590 [Erythrobacter sp.]|nr:hypothetical protein [Erythrobacter sp.]